MEVSEKEQEQKIIKVLTKHNELYTKQVAELTGLSTNTVSKYLSVLEKEGRVKMRKQKPFKFWKLKPEEKG